jgi:hypothetical protein
MDFEKYVSTPVVKLDDSLEKRIVSMYEADFINRVYCRFLDGLLDGEQLHFENQKVINHIKEMVKDQLYGVTPERIRGILIKNRMYVATSHLNKPEPRPVFNWTKYKRDNVAPEIIKILRWLSSTPKQIKAYLDYLEFFNTPVAESEIAFLRNVLKNCAVRG